MERLAHAKRYAAKLRIARGKPGFVYMIQCQDFIKAGLAVNVQTRLFTLQTGCPHELILLKHWPVSNMAEAEASLHRLWLAYHHRGEWYRLPFGTITAAINCDTFEEACQA